MNQPEEEVGVPAGADPQMTAETLDVGPCRRCGRQNPPDAQFCGGCGAQLVSDGEHSPDVADPLIGQTIADRYRIVALLGRGGMGVVYKVEHVHIGKFMAMKLLHGELARDRNTVKRFQREADAASRLSHPNTVAVFDFGRSEGLMYLVMEYLDGRDLGQLVRDEGHLEFARVAKIGAQVCASVSEAHGIGIVHRDIKPENVMIVGREDRDIAKVLDFGLAKLRDHQGNVTVTRAGHIVGTPYYMPPEQIRGEEVDQRGDIYAIGAMLYKACTGAPPFVANTPMGVLTKHLTEPLILPSARSGVYIPPMADQIIGRAMSKEPADRFQSADDMREALASYLASTGNEVADPALRSQGASGRSVVAVSNLATRKDVDAYEKRLHRRGLLTYLLAAVALVGLGAGAWTLWQRFHKSEVVLTVEHEPNNTPDTANPLPIGVELEGFIGQRHSHEFSDTDFYIVRNSTGERRLLNLHVTSLPNIDLVVDVIRVGQSQPALTADSGGAGVAERIPNFPIQAAEYYLRVHERWIAGNYPTENVSDPYRIKWELATHQEGWEKEVNDSLELAEILAIDTPVQGYIGWRGDNDTYCLEQDAAAVQAHVSGIDGLDLVIRTVDRVRLSSQTYNRAGAGAEETSETITAARAEQTCFEVSSASDEGVIANGAVPYTFTLRSVAP